MPYRHGSNSSPAMPPARLSLCDRAEPSYYYLDGCGADSEREDGFDDVYIHYRPGETILPHEERVMARWGGDRDDEALGTVWLVPVSVSRSPYHGLMSHPYRVEYRVQRDEPLEDDIEPLAVPKGREIDVLQK